MQDVFETSGKDELELVIQHGVTQSTLQGEYQWREELEESVMTLDSLQPIRERYTLAPIELEIPNTKLLPFVVQPLVLELKALPEHLKYVYLGDNETLPIIIASDLTSVQEDN